MDLSPGLRAAIREGDPVVGMCGVAAPWTRREWVQASLEPGRAPAALASEHTAPRTGGCSPGWSWAEPGPTQEGGWGRRGKETGGGHSRQDHQGSSRGQPEPVHSHQDFASGWTNHPHRGCGGSHLPKSSPTPDGSGHFLSQRDPTLQLTVYTAHHRNRWWFTH